MGCRPEGSMPLAAKTRFCRTNLAWSKLWYGQHAVGKDEDDISPADIRILTSSVPVS